MATVFVTVKPDLSEFPEKIKAVDENGDPLAFTMTRGEHYEVTGTDEAPIVTMRSSSISA